MIQNENFIGRPIRSMQTMLRVVFQQDHNAPTIIPDGIFGPQTENAVKYFQRTRELPVTGVMDNTTWDTLAAAYDNALIEQNPAAPLLLVLQPGQIIHTGDWNYHLFLIQAILAALARIHTDFPQVPVSGVLDAQTGRSISYFQALSGLPATGEIDKKTWQYLANHYAHAAGDGTEWAAAAPGK